MRGRRVLEYPIKVSLLAVLLVAAVSMAGCGSRRTLAPVTGKVLYQGKPLRFGAVVFLPEHGQPATGVIQPDGTFQMVTHGEGDGAAVGRNRVRIACYEGQDSDAKAKAAAAHEERSLGKPLIPERYSSCDMSGIAVDVRPGANEPLVLKLTDRP